MTRSSHQIHFRRRAFTLTELLVVIGVMLLMVVLAIPTLSLLSGSRSIDGAQNQVAAILSIARSGAMGIPITAASPGGITAQIFGSNLTSQVEGVFFYQDPSTGRRMMQLVQSRADPLTPSFTTAAAQVVAQNIDVYLDCVPNTIPVPLPSGVGIAFVADVSSPKSGPVNDRYIGFNSVNGANSGAYDKSTGNTTTGVRTYTYNDVTSAYFPPKGTGGVRWGNVILFDSSGNLVSLRWGLRVSVFGTYGSAASTYRFTAMGRLLYGVPDLNSADSVKTANYPDLLPRNWNYYYPSNPPVPNPQVFPLRSAMAFVLFDQARYDANNFILDQSDPGNGESNLTVFGDPSQTWDSSIASPPGPTSYNRMNWLDSNTTALMINRYNGTLIRTE